MPPLTTEGGCEILRGADFCLWSRQSVALVALSGAGKSTLLHIAGLLGTPCFHISRGDSVHATLRKPELKFCSRYEALAAPKPTHSQKRPPILPGERFLCEPCLVVFVSSGTFGERKAVGEADE